MGVVWWCLVLLACGGGAESPEPSREVLILTAPPAEGRPPYQVQVSAPDGATDHGLEPAALFKGLGQALEGPIARCTATAEPYELEDLWFEGELSLDGEGGGSLIPRTTSGAVASCIVDAVTATPLAGLPEVAVPLGFGVRILSDDEVARAVPPDEAFEEAPDEAPPEGATPEGASGEQAPSADGAPATP